MVNQRKDRRNFVLCNGIPERCRSIALITNFTETHFRYSFRHCVKPTIVSVNSIIGAHIHIFIYNLYNKKNKKIRSEDGVVNAKTCPHQSNHLMRLRQDKVVGCLCDAECNIFLLGL